jgi:hypothetical protein
MDFVEVETEDGRLLINIYEIVYMSELGGITQIKLKGSPITLTVATTLDEIIEQLNGGYDDGYGISFTSN